MPQQEFLLFRIESDTETVCNDGTRVSPVEEKTLAWGGIDGDLGLEPS